MAYLPPIEAQDILICPSRWAHTNSKILQTYSNWIESTSLREDGCRLTNHPSKPKTSANSARREANKQDVSPSLRRARHTDAPWSHSVMNVPRTYHMWNTYKRWQNIIISTYYKRDIHPRKEKLKSNPQTRVTGTPCLWAALIHPGGGTVTSECEKYTNTSIKCQCQRWYPSIPSFPCTHLSSW